MGIYACVHFSAADDTDENQTTHSPTNYHLLMRLPNEQKICIFATN